MHLLSLLLVGITCVFAIPDPCVFNHFGQLAKVRQCASVVIDSISVPAGVTLDLTNLPDGTHVTFKGTISFGFAHWPGPLVSISGSNLTITGAPGSVLNGEGARYWDGLGGNGGAVKPKFLALHKITHSVVSNISIKNPPVHTVSISNSHHLQVKGMLIDAHDGNTQGGHNTDGFDVGESQFISITDAKVYNQDDCLAINSGSDISFSNGLCDGGHGLSIGGVGGYRVNEVARVRISDSIIRNSENGVRIKTQYEGHGSVDDVLYENIKLENITKFGIIIEQDYRNLGPTCIPTDGVPISHVRLRNIHGNVASKAVPIAVICAACKNWEWDHIDVRGKKINLCIGVPGGVPC
jgi:polygalacturonase